MWTKNDLKSLSVGDRAYIHSWCSINHQYRETSIIKKTKTQLTTADGIRWLISTGCKYGQSQKTRGWFDVLETVEYYKETNA